MASSISRPDITLPHDDTQLQRLTQKAHESPFIAAGMTGWLLAALYGAYRYKTQGTKTKLSLFLIQLRVAAQGIVVGACTLGVGYTLYRDYIKKPNDEQQ